MAAVHQGPLGGQVRWVLPGLVLPHVLPSLAAAILLMEQMVLLAGAARYLQ